MGKFINHGWSKPGDDIPQPVSLVTGANLRKPVTTPSLARPFGWEPAEHEAKLNDGDGQ